MRLNVFWILFLTFVGWMVALSFAVAQDVAPTDPAVLPAGAVDSITSLVVSLAQKFPAIFTAIAIIGALRILIKPVIAALHAYAASTDTPKDDELIAKIENSKALKGIMFVLDLVCSIKIRK